MGDGDEEPTVEELAELVARQASVLTPWESAELHVLAVMLRDRLGALRIPVSPDVGAVLMVVAQLLAERPPEWGGDARDTLSEIAVLGLRLLDADDERPG